MPTPLRRIMIAIAAMSLLVSPTLADGPAQADALIGTSWKLAEIDGKPADPAVNSTLNISADGVGGNGGCNTYGGKFRTTPTGIDITEIISTMMACDGLPQEQAFIAALEAATDYALADGDLVFTANDKTLARLSPAS